MKRAKKGSFLLSDFHSNCENIENSHGLQCYCSENEVYCMVYKKYQYILWLYLSAWRNIQIASDMLKVILGAMLIVNIKKI